MDFNSADLGRGRALLSEADPRWEWKLAQHKQMRGIRARAGELGWSTYKLGSNRLRNTSRRADRTGRDGLRMPHMDRSSHLSRDARCVGLRM